MLFLDLYFSKKLNDHFVFIRHLEKKSVPIVQPFEHVRLFFVFPS